MNTGVELLIKRLKDCPEDFHYDPTTDRSSKWNSLLMEALRSDVITEEEKVALRAEVTEMGRERFTKKVMQTLAGVEDEPSEVGKYPTSSIGMGGATLGTWANGLTTNALYQSAQAQQALVTTNTTGVTLPSGSITLGSTTLSEAGLIQMLATHRAMREETKPKHWWNKSIPELLGKK